MGRKHPWAGQLIYFCVASLLIFPFWGCSVKQKNFSSQEEGFKKFTAIQPIRGGTLLIPIIQNDSLAAVKDPVSVLEEEREATPPPQEEIPKDKKPEGETKESEGILKARKLLEEGDFDGSLEESQKVLSFPGGNNRVDQALFNIGLIYAHFGNAKKDYGKSISFFKKLLKDYPQSPLCEEARIWIEVLQENKKLIEVIEKSKEVDIAVEEKKREKER